MVTSKLFTAAMVLGVRPAGYFRKTVRDRRITKKNMPEFVRREVAAIKENFATAVVNSARENGAEKGVKITADFVRAVSDVGYRKHAFAADGPSAVKTSAAFLKVYDKIDDAYTSILAESAKV